MKKNILPVVCCVFLFYGSIRMSSLYSQTPPPDISAEFESRSYDHKGKALPYQILLPKNFNTSQKYPLHLFLHGAGERGDDNQAQLKHGSQLFIKDERKLPSNCSFSTMPI